MDLLKAAAEVARFLDAQGVPYAVIGGLALQHWGEPRFTRDVDLTVVVPGDDVPAFVSKVLATFSPRVADAARAASRKAQRILRSQHKEGA